MQSVPQEAVPTCEDCKIYGLLSRAFRCTARTGRLRCHDCGHSGQRRRTGRLHEGHASAVYNDLSSVETLFEEFPKEIAAVIVEPVAANMGLLYAEGGILEGLRSLCTKYGSVAHFDEVITGFRLGFEGAQGYFNVDADLVTYGKIIGRNAGRRLRRQTRRYVDGISGRSGLPGRNLKRQSGGNAGRHDSAENFKKSIRKSIRS